MYMRENWITGELEWVESRYDNSYDEHHHGCHSEGESDPDEPDNILLMSIMSPGWFPDDLEKKHSFSDEICERVMDIECNNCKPIITNLNKTREEITRPLEQTSFEQLWETTLYLRDIVAIGRKRRPIDDASEAWLTNTTCNLLSNSQQTIYDEEQEKVKNIYMTSLEIFSKHLTSDVLDIPNHWFSWCNETIIDGIQRLIPYNVPYLAWNSIISYLSFDEKDETDIRQLSLQLTTLSSSSEELKVIEKGFIQESTKTCTELIKYVALLLFSQQSSVEQDKLSLKISKCFLLFDTAMSRLAAFLDSASTSSNCLNFRVKDQLKTRILDELQRDDAKIEMKYSDLDLRNMVYANTEFQYISQYFTFLSKKSGSSETYNLLYSNKNVSNGSKVKIDVIENAVNSVDRPTLYCSGSVVAAVSIETSKSGDLVWYLSLWNLEPTQEKLFQYKLDRLAKIFKKRGLPIDGIDKIYNIGMSKMDNIVTVIVSIRFGIPNEKSAAACCAVLTYNMNEDAECAGPCVKTTLGDALLLSIHKNYAFFINFELDSSSTLTLQDLNKNFKCLTKVPWDIDNQWKIRFNNNPDNSTCMLYRKNEVQIRKLDDDLSFVKDVSLSYNDTNTSVLDDPCVQFYDNILYGYRKYRIQDNEMDKQYAKHIIDSDKVVDITEFFASLFTMFGEEFVVDIEEESGELVYFEPNRAFLNHTRQTRATNCYKITMTGFTTRGDLKQMVLTSGMDSCTPDKMNTGCAEVQALTVQFHSSFQELVGALIPPATQLLTKYRATKAQLAAEERQRQERLAQEHAEREKRARDKATKASRKHIRMAKAQKFIDARTKFKSVLTAWFYGQEYGFASIEIGDEEEDVFVHQSSLSKSKDRYKLQKGCEIEFAIQWQVSKPRPKAINTSVL